MVAISENLMKLLMLTKEFLLTEKLDYCLIYNIYVFIFQSQAKAIYECLQGMKQRYETMNIKMCVL